MKNFKLEIRTPYGVMLDEELYSLTVNTEDGQITILNKHASLITSIMFSPTIIRQESGDKEILIRNGILHFDHNKNKATIVCSTKQKRFESVYFDTKEKLEEVKGRIERSSSSLNSLQYEHLEEEMIALMKKIAYIEKKGTLKEGEKSFK